MAIITVTSTADSGAGSLRQAISDAASGDTIEFDAVTFPANTETVISFGSYITLLAETLEIDGGATWTNNGVLKTRVVLDGQSTYSAFRQSNANCSPAFKNITFANCKSTSSGANSGGSVSFSAGTANFINCIFNNSTSAQGGGACRLDNVSCSFNGCVFDTCTTLGSYSGGTLRIAGTSTFTINNCVFKNCYTGNSGGSIYFGGTASGTVTNSSFYNSSSGSSGSNKTGGAITVFDSVNVTISNCSFDSCTSVYGGAIDCDSSSQTTLIDCTFTNNTATHGGDIYNKATIIIAGFISVNSFEVVSGKTVTFSGVDSVLTVKTSFVNGGATFQTSTDSTGYLALYVSATAPTVGTGIKICTYGADILTASIDEDSVNWTATNISTPILIERQNNSTWNTLTDNATSGTYSGDFSSGATVRLFDGVTFRTVTYTPPTPPTPTDTAEYWLVNSFAVEAGNWTINASAIATNGGGGTDPVTGDPLPYWTITTDDITPNF